MNLVMIGSVLWLVLFRLVNYRWPVLFWTLFTIVASMGIAATFRMRLEQVDLVNGAARD